ncbi:hypothetical protein B1757_03915 [Acidithiobacillus marinus]|uniref:TonB-dependent receptor plug domain-containing protein n=1 Tax=Acidithiobacillus marinus TaxID=187490 RepID=A0A2I1DNX0_9PROT|nr:TonB-dependent receptor plug domain-containing protein [Acidithiobacillus marinus]PKY11559.1 hypothetical protein B1757_03915 [Acidithiobacillus marinus]
MDTSCKTRWRLLVVAISAALTHSAGAWAQDHQVDYSDAPMHKHSHHHHDHKHAVNVGEVNKNSEYQETVIPTVPSQKKIFHSAYSEKLITKGQIAALGPMANSAEILSVAPGVHVVGSYGNTGATKMQININGIKQGWGHLKGDVSGHSIMVTFDGIPMNDPATGLWQSPQVNQPSLLSGVSVVYGPGNPAQRWYNNLGGAINFLPLQPTRKAGAEIGMGERSKMKCNTSGRRQTEVRDGQKIQAIDARSAKPDTAWIESGAEYSWHCQAVGPKP